MKKILCLGLIAALNLGCASFVAADTNIPTFTPTVINSAQTLLDINEAKVKISTKTVKDLQASYELNLEIPVLEGVEDKEIQTYLNSFLEKDILTFAEDIKNQGIAFAQDCKKEGWEVRPYGASTIFKVTYNTNNFLSISAIYWADTLGAHGNSFRKTFNFDLTSGKQLALKDLFSKGENYISIINEEIQKQITANPTNYYTGADASFITIDPNQNFGIENGNVILYFNPYEIAPFSSGAPEFKIPFSLFKSGIKTAFTLNPDAVKIIPNIIAEKNEALISDIKLPVLKGLKDEKIQNDLNKGFEAKAMALKEELNKEGKEALEDAKKYDYEARPYGLYMDYDISYNEKNLLSITNSYYRYTGGAHGTSIAETSNINMKTGKKIVLQDLFKENVDYKKIITEEIKKQMSTKDIYFEDSIAKLETISETQDFYIEEGGIVVYYQQYEIGPSALGIPEFKIPFSLFQNNLKLDLTQ